MIISLGEALIDFVSREGLTFEGFPGGSPYNTAIAISRLNTECHFLGRVSNDLFGKQLIDYLKENSVSTDMIVTTEDKSTLSFVQKQDDGLVEYAFFANDTADRNWKIDDFSHITIHGNARIIHFGSISISQEPCGTQLFSFLKKLAGKILLSFDPNIRPSQVPDRDLYMKRFKTLCGISEIVKLSDEDLEWLYPGMESNDALKELRELGPSIIALTRGSEGAVILNKHHKVLVPILKQKVSDTIGAGDTFHGALLDYLYKKNWLSRESLDNLTIRELEAIGSYANKAAGLNCMKPGADPPTENEMR
jgi:fructokinase